MSRVVQSPVLFPASPVRIALTVCAAALANFVDVFDIVLFTLVRQTSLADLGFSDEALLSHGILLLNLQLVGMLIGGVFWGVLGDKKGRVPVLLGAVLVYSSANLANAFVSTLPQYAICRFVAGLGLGGELGAGIALVCEMMSRYRRGLGTMIIAAAGSFGLVAAGVVAAMFSWRNAYLAGGILGLLLLFSRLYLAESPLFREMVAVPGIRRGDLVLICRSLDRLRRLLSCVAVAIPFWAFFGILTTFSPEIAVDLGVRAPVEASTAVAMFGIGVTLGDIASSFLSQFLQSRKDVIGLFLFAALGCMLIFLSRFEPSPQEFYLWYAAIGLFFGYWAVILTAVAEHFGTNLRATVAVATPNLVRGMGVPLSLVFLVLRPELGTIATAQLLIIGSSMLGFIGLLFLKETFGEDLAYLETNGDAHSHTGSTSSSSIGEQPLPGMRH